MSSLEDFFTQKPDVLSQKLLDGFKYQPTSDQIRTSKHFAHFLLSPDDVSIFILRGYAGTGKTTLITHFIKHTARNDFRNVLLAPTGKAAKVLARKAKRAAYTLHRYFYHSELSLYGKYHFKLKKNTETIPTIFWIDESSMISNISQIGGENLLNDIIKYVQNPEHQGILFKVVFIGDPAQLPPIGQESSPALDDSYFLKKYNYRVFSFTMTDIKRQHLDSGILYNATRVRQYLTQPHLPELQDIYINLQKPDIFVTDSLSEFIQEFCASFSLDKIDSAGLFTFSNQAALKLNSQIRSLLFYEPDEIQAGDLLIVIKNNYSHLVAGMPFIANGDTCVVSHIYHETIEEHEGNKWVWADLRFENQNGEAVEVSTYVYLNLLHSAEPNISADQQQKIYSFFKHNKNHNKELAHALQVKFGYAITGHKAQGGQWEKGFIYFEQIYQNISLLNYLRWCYTTLTRAEKQLVMFNCPFTVEPEKITCYRQNFSFQKNILTNEIFQKEEREFLAQYGESVISLLNGTLAPNTLDRKHLIQVVNADTEPTNIRENAILKYVQLFEVIDNEYP